ncbi:SDR family NAD(P)-dependent oxidoreductase [Aspergillus fijiensis CBS 313.89]|uniref:NAD(P)-binding protein n=1 Tax=Aspergillus fijiensis CBS 313.89 TaxID=1448319 RepID=A0A8G1RZX8_9EURO|nr:NAD(P)-binding protein [Aspergillus fijiensis CBS 313.89]RAK81867.1 NAD(P)-binding protein [Aspergillus fijiensis CBS 313.89]
MPSDSKTYILTGGFSGIGLAILTRLLTPKHPDTPPPTIHVLDLASAPPTLPATLPTATIHFYPNTDVTSRAGITATFDRILAQSSQIDGLINSAGICPPPTIGGIENDELFDRVLDVNLRGTWIVGTEFLKHVLNRDADAAAGNPGAAGGGGVHVRAAIVNIASTAAFSPPPGMVAYATSKYAVLGLTKAWAKEYTSRGVRVNCVAPGGTRTPLVDSALTEGMIDAYAESAPMGRLAAPEEIASVVGFLLEGGAGFVSGQMVVVDGAYYL